MKLNEYSLWVFDLDGTLIDSTQDIAYSINILREQLALEPWPQSRIQQNIGWGVEHLLRFSLPDSFLDMAALKERYREIYSQHLLDNTRPFVKAKDLLQSLQQSTKKIALLSNKPEGFSNQILSSLGLRQYFEFVVGGDSLPKRKPDPSCLEYILRLADAPVHKTVMVGDSKVDLDTASACGCDAILLNEKELDSPFCYHFKRLQDLWQAVNDQIIY